MASHLNSRDIHQDCGSDAGPLVYQAATTLFFDLYAGLISK